MKIEISNFYLSKNFDNKTDIKILASFSLLISTGMKQKSNSFIRLNKLYLCKKNKDYFIFTPSVPKKSDDNSKKDYYFSFSNELNELITNKAKNRYLKEKEF
ncbi:hypothetical protein [[Mycoplasma] collis]|uniref:hypothetical protein n=1 Tax=[Mycoplasma] collis TaxID=2127 RepID=UPI00051C2C89|nr:hypothetical protein [[Mycoplasma] collis]